MHHLKEYEVYASKTPSKEELSPQVFKTTVFAPNEVIAKGKTFNMLRKQYKIKSTQGTILKMVEVPQYTDVKVRTFKIDAAYRSKSGYHKLQKEVRDISRVHAVSRLQQDLRTRHKATTSTIVIVKVEEIDEKDITSKDLLQITKDPKYPLFDKRVPATTEKLQTVSIVRE
ncbi:large subunit ribosomal protein L18Ae [Nematocida sp. AWRm77]|nr:large subunit ribosomal protein L18Ae [Nematocida sp. AWRm77]